MGGEFRAKYRYRYVEFHEFDDGVFIDTGSEPHDVEYREAEVQIWRDRDGKIVAIDFTYKED